MTEPAPLEAALVEQISHARWFGGKGRAFTITDVRVLSLSTGEPDVTIALVSIAYTDPSAGSGTGQPADTDVYQLPLASYVDPQDRLSHAFIAELDGRHLYDALHDEAATRVWLEAFAAGSPATDTGLSFHRSGQHDLDLSSGSKLFSGEQSNSSVAFGQDALMKVFRRVTAGINPDIEIHDALTRGGADSIAALYGWVELAPSSPDDQPMQLAMLQQFLAGATDGWDLALASARAALTGNASGTGAGTGVGTGTDADFTEEARSLGVAVSEVHQLLRDQFGISPLDGRTTAAHMRERLSAAHVVVAELAPHIDALEGVFSRLEQAEGEVQRVHGDLHLGQTLRTARGWKIVDFEGEPAKPLAERRLPDSPWRDVAGMLRSFDYAAESVVKELSPADETNDPDPQIASRAQDWLHRNRGAFLEGYLAAGQDDAERTVTVADRAVIDAYEADKAVYEVIYEARNRPTWLDIPLQAIDRIGAEK